MSYRIHIISGAPRPWRVLLVLAAKKLDFDIVVLECSKREHKSPAFLALNPRGRVPVLQNGGFVLRESLAILAYLERLHPEVPLFGVTAEESARIWEQVMEGDHDLFTTTEALLRPLLAEGKAGLSDSTRAKADAVHPELRQLASKVDGAPFLSGSGISVADCVAFPQVRLVARAIERFPDVMAELGFRPLEQAYPSLARWVERVEALPGYAKIVPPHWTRAASPRPSERIDYSSMGRARLRRR